MNGGPKMINREGKGGRIVQAGELLIRGQDLAKRTRLYPKMQGSVLEGLGRGRRALSQKIG